MKRIDRIMKTGVLTVGATLLVIASFGLSPSTVDAKPKDDGLGHPCFSYGPNGITGLYVDGDKTTVTDEDGKKHTFRCNGATGMWEEVENESVIRTTGPVTRTTR
jgi:hypothetical protein